MEIATHNGQFHTDDVLAVALLLELHPNASVVRTRDDARLAQADIVVDVGKVFDAKAKRFDHHQKQAGARPNGIIYSGFGLVWREYGLQFCDDNETVWRRIDETLAAHVDAHDNGQRTYTCDHTEVEPFLIEDVIRLFNPSPLDKTEANRYDEFFMKAVELGRFVLNRMKKAELETAAAEATFLQSYAQSADKRFVVLEEKLPFKQLLPELPELLYVVYPYETGESWMAQAVALYPNSFQPRRPFPEAWRGASVEQLRQLTGVDDVIFCHAGGFIAGAVSRQGATELMYKSLGDK